MIVRIGVVIAADGMLAGILPLFRWRIGRSLGPPQTPGPWIDIRDLARMLVHVAEVDASGSFNLVGPSSPSFGEFSEVVQRELRRRSWFGLPKVVVRAALGRHAADLVLARYDARPDRAVATGFVFAHTDLAESIRHALAQQ